MPTVPKTPPEAPQAEPVPVAPTRNLPPLKRDHMHAVVRPGESYGHERGGTLVQVEIAVFPTLRGCLMTLEENDAYKEALATAKDAQTLAIDALEKATVLQRHADALADRAAALGKGTP